MPHYIELFRTFDPFEASDLETLLIEEGLVIRRIGSPPLRGNMGSDFQEERIEVLEEQIERARQIVTTFRSEIELESKEELPWELQEDTEEGADGGLSLVEDKRRGGALSIAVDGGRLAITDDPEGEDRE